MLKLAEFIENLGLGDNNSIVLSEHPEVFFMLSQFEEFKNVKKFNLLEFPIYNVSRETGEIMNMGDVENLGESYKVETTQTRLINDENEDGFAEEIDIYSIDLTPHLYNPDLLKSNFIDWKIGIDKYPTFFNPADFSSYDAITIAYSLTNIMDMEKLTRDEAKEVVKNRIIKKITNLIDSDTTTIKGFRKAMVRCSTRSFKKIEK